MIRSPLSRMRRWLAAFQISTQSRLTAITSLYPSITLALLFGVAIVDIILVPALHLGAFLYPVPIISALWWGGKRAVLVVTGLAIALSSIAMWRPPSITFNISPLPPLVALDTRLSSLLLLALFGSACRWIARQQEKYVHAQNSLTDLEAKLTAVIELTPDALVLASDDGTIIFWNTSAERIFGYSKEDVLGQPLTLIMPPRFHQAHQHGIQRVCETGVSHMLNRPIEVTGLRKNQTEFPLELSLATWKTKGVRYFGGFLRDLTERKRLEIRQSVQLAISQILIEFDTVQQAGSRILQAIGILTDWEVGLIWLLDQRTHTLRGGTVWEKSAQLGLETFLQQSLRTTFSSGVGLPGRVLADGEPQWITNVVHDGNFPRLELAQAAGLHAAFAFPIKGTQGVLGVIEFFAHEVRPPDASLLHTFADIGLKVGQFIERRRLAEETAALISELQALTASPSISGLLPICATCKRIRDHNGSWQEVEAFIAQHSTAQFSHTICGTCARQAHPDWDTA